MQKNFIKKNSAELYLFDTNVENMFINEYMLDAPGEYVKVYLLALMYANSEYDVDNEDLAKQLSMEIEDVLKAWTYWEAMGVIRKVHSEFGDKVNYGVELLNLKEQLYGKRNHRKKSEPSDILIDLDIRELYKKIEGLVGRPLGGKEPVTILTWMQEFGANEEQIQCAYEYCVKRNKDSVRYVSKVVKEWAEKGFTTRQKIEEHLQEIDSKHSMYKRIMTALGFQRNATEKEKEIMDAWFGEMGLSLDVILEACNKTSGISNPNINYVNRVLENWQQERGINTSKEKKGEKVVSAADVNRYYDYIREKAENEAAERKQEVYDKIPEIKDIDEQIRRMSMELSRIMVSGAVNAKERLADFRKKIGELGEEKAFKLTEANLPIDYMEIRYKCQNCKDTGTNDMGGRCDCFFERQSEAKLWQNSSTKIKI